MQSDIVVNYYINISLVGDKKIVEIFIQSQNKEINKNINFQSKINVINNKVFIIANGRVLFSLVLI